MNTLPLRIGRVLRAAVCGLLAATSAGHAEESAKDYPSRPIRIVVSAAAGGPADVLARLVASRLSKRVGQPVIVDNRPGASASIAADLVAHSPPDGYTVLVTTVQHIINPYINPKLPYDSVKDFAPVTIMAQAQLLLLCNPALPVRDLKEFVAYAKQHPGQVNWAHSGIGGTGHLAIELLAYEAGIDVLKVPYKGTAPAMNDLLGGQVQCMSAATASVLPFVKQGRLRALAIAGPQRSSLLPDVMTVGEQGFPRSEAPGPLALMAPARTPAALIDKLQANIAAVVKSPDMKDLLANQGFEPVGSTPAQYADYLQREGQLLGEVITKANIKFE